MKQANLTELPRNLSTVLNFVDVDHEPLMVTRRYGKPVVMMSLEEYEALCDAVAPRAVNVSGDVNLLSSFSEVDEITFVPDASSSLRRVVAE